MVAQEAFHWLFPDSFLLHSSGLPTCSTWHLKHRSFASQPNVISVKSQSSLLYLKALVFFLSCIKMNKVYLGREEKARVILSSRENH
jgi:hypothetical protein